MPWSSATRPGGLAASSAAFIASRGAPAPLPTACSRRRSSISWPSPFRRSASPSRCSMPATTACASRPPTAPRYRSQSFIVVPLVHQSRRLGVLSITDKRDGSAFGSAEQLAVKTAASLIATALNGERAQAEVERLEHAASVDSLTGLLNRSYLDSRLQQEVSRSEREGTQLAVLMADIDAFKSINDTGGHQAGDAVLRQVGDIIRSAVRVFDVCARWGGDEFAILMPRCDHAAAMACAERIRRRTAEALKDAHGGRSGVTVSIGVVVGAPGDTAVDLIARADRALYDAK